MATQTEFYKLNKPARTDNIDIELLNKNFDTIDALLKELAETNNAVLEVHITYNEETDEYTTDKWYSDIVNAINTGMIVIAKVIVTDFSERYAQPFIKDQSMVYFELQTDSLASNFTEVFGVGEGNHVEYWSNNRFYLPDASEADEGKAPVVRNGQWSTDYISTSGSPTTKLDFSDWANGSFTEHLDDGTFNVHNVVRDGAGAITSIGDITIVGVG